MDNLGKKIHALWLNFSMENQKYGELKNFITK